RDPGRRFPRARCAYRRSADNCLWSRCAAALPLPPTVLRRALRHADTLRQSAHERFALRKLLQAYPFVRLMRLLDVAGPANDRGNAGLVKQRCFGAERHFAKSVAAVERVAEGGDL